MIWGRITRPRRVYVLGAGPAGLLAAHAAQSKGYDVTVFARPDRTGIQAAKSELFGCQYLHAYIPGVGLMKDGWEKVNYQLSGSPDGYRAKVYGQNYTGPVSPDEYGPEEEHRAWDLRKAYNALWQDWGRQVVPVHLNAEKMQPLTADQFAWVFSTIPVPDLCKKPDLHNWPSQDIWAMGSRSTQDAHERMPYVAPDFSVECNGFTAPRWYRAATVFGHSTLEWPGGARPPIEGVAAVSKPLSTDCGCWVGRRYHRVGRYGRWQKGVLVHTAYFDTLDILP